MCQGFGGYGYEGVAVCEIFWMLGSWVSMCSGYVRCWEFKGVCHLWVWCPWSLEDVCCTVVERVGVLKGYDVVLYWFC